MITRLRRLLPAVALAAIAVAAPAAEAPLIDVAAGPSAGLLERFAASPYGKVWADPALKPLRDALDEERRKEIEREGIDIWGAIAAQRGAGFRLLAFDSERARLAWIADLGEAAAGIAAKLRAGGAADEIAGADEAWRKNEALFARFGTVLRGGKGFDVPPEWKPETGEDDLVARFDLRRICEAAIAANPDARIDPALPALIAKLGEASVAVRLGTDDLSWTSKVHCPTGGLAPLARARLERLPGNALEASALGIDGAALWREYGPAMLALAAAASDRADGEPRFATPDQARQAADEALAGVGLPPLADLLGALHGTELFFTTPGMPFPGYTMVLERNPTLDAIVAALLKRAGIEAPAEGVATPLPIPNLPLMPQVLMTRDEWLLSTDQALPATRTTPPAAGARWLDSPAGKAAAAGLDERCVMIGASDTAAQLRMLSGMAGMALGNIPNLTPAQKQAVMAGLTKLAAAATPGWSLVRVGPDGIEGRAHGMSGSGSVAVVAIIAAIAIPNLLESRVAAQESAAATSLKSGILPAEVLFQSNAYVDQDGNGIGEYGFLSEMSGAVEVHGEKLNLLAPSFQKPQPVVSGYRYAVFLPDADGTGALTDPAGARPVGAVGERERRWVAYAWPAAAKQGRRMFAIDQSGTVYTERFQGQAPEWNALMGGGGWADQPAWKPYRRR